MFECDVESISCQCRLELSVIEWKKYIVGGKLSVLELKRE